MINITLKLCCCSLFVTFLTGTIALASENSIFATHNNVLTYGNDNSFNSILLAQADTVPSVEDRDLELGREIEDHRARKPEGSLVSGSDMFGEGGYVHPFISIAEIYSDNIFSENTEKDSDFSTIVSPGVWFAMPSSRTQLLDLNTSNSMPGGLATWREKTTYFKRYQTYLLYQADFTAYHDYSDSNTNNHRVEGLFEYNLKGGLSFDIVEEYKKSQDPYSTAVSTQLDKYQTNLVDTTISYDLSELFMMRAGYSNFWVEYDDVANEGRNRLDNSFSAYVSYKAKPKTTLFTEYKFTDVDYDKQTVSGSEMHYINGGLNWDVTPKTSLKIKTGYVHKDFDTAGIDDVDDIEVELRGVFNFKTNASAQLTAQRSVTETITVTADYMLTHSVSLSYIHDLNSKISANFLLSYASDKYQRIGTQERRDDIYSFFPGVDYAFTDWLLAGLTYSYTERDSNFDANDYTNNIFLLRGTISF